ncbi:MAG: Hsp20 family protein [bacterium]
MSKIKQKISISDAEDKQIRRVWDNQRARWYFSITDIIGVLTESVDARNYWKTLKNRLKNTQNQLVSECNQLKLQSSDGKSYLADVADADTLIKIIKIIDPTSIPAFKTWFEHVDVQNSVKNTNFRSEEVDTNSPFDDLSTFKENELSTTLEAPADIYENKNEIVVQFMLPGCDPSKLILSISMQTLTIAGVRVAENFNTYVNTKKIYEPDYILKELQWGTFSRRIELPTLVDVDNMTATEFQGLITITLQKIDINKKRFIKIKSI